MSKLDLTTLESLYHQPLPELLFKAQSVHRKHFDSTKIQLSALLSIKTGACPEDCAYCPQSVHYSPGLNVEPLMQLEMVKQAAKKAKLAGATRFCLGAAWRQPTTKQLNQVAKMVEVVKSLGLESCATLGTLDKQQAQSLRQSGLDYYNHNLDTSREFYPEIISTRPYEERLQTLSHVRESGMKVCCGGILGMGETLVDRLKMLLELCQMPAPPESIPINTLVPVEGTPLADQPPVDVFDLIRMIACTRMMLPKSYIRLSAGRSDLSDEGQAMCFIAGANSIFYGDKLLTTGNPDVTKDSQLLEKLGMFAESCEPAVEEINA